MNNDTYALLEMTLHEKIKFPKDFDPDAKSLIKKLTKHNLSERFGNLRKGADDIKDHRFFKNLSWLELGWKKIIPPYKPTSAIT